MSEFLELHKPQQFWDKLVEEARITPVSIEKVSYYKSLDRVLARELVSTESLPPFTRSTVDGFALRAVDTAGASGSMPVYLEVIGDIDMGQSIDFELGPGQAAAIPTGGMLPGKADAVIMIEHTDYLNNRTIEVNQAVASGENVVKKGEDIKKGQQLLERGHRLRSQDIGALAGLGITEVPVFEIPEITVISTGDELVSPETNPAPGQIRDINSYTISSFVKKKGARVRTTGIVTDTFDQLSRAVKDNLDTDLILLSGGSSVGIKDLTIEVLNHLGQPGVLLHGISLKPGKPTILAVINRTPVIGLPGHPASAWTVSLQLVGPLIESMLGIRDPRTGINDVSQPTIQAELTRNLDSDKGREEYVPVRITEPASVQTRKEEIEEQSVSRLPRACPITGKSSLITTLVAARGLIKIDSFQEGLAAGTVVEVRLLTS